MNQNYPQYVLNPLTGNQIKVNGPTYLKLVEKGVITPHKINQINNDKRPSSQSSVVPTWLSTSAHYVSNDRRVQTLRPNKNIETRKNHKQCGGNPLLAAAANLIVPIGLTAGAHWLSNIKKSTLESTNQNQIGGSHNKIRKIANMSVPIGLTITSSQNKNKKNTLQHTHRDNQTGGAITGIPFIDEPIMNSYLAMNNISFLTPQTLIPLGILIAVYFAYKYRYDISPPESKPFNPITEQFGGVRQQLHLIIDPKDLKKYMQIQHIDDITPQTKLPFAIIMGPDVFKQYVKQLQRK